MMLIVFLFILFAFVAGHLKIEAVLAEMNASLTVRWSNVALCAITCSAIFYIGTFFL